MNQSALIYHQPVSAVSSLRRSIRPVKIAEPEARILLALARFQRLTAIQITRLLYRPTSLTTIQTRLKRMTVEQGLLGRDFPHGPQRAGSAPWIYFLERRGCAAVEAMGIALPRFRREEGIRGFLFYDHALLVNEILIQLDLLAQQVDEIQIETLLLERTLKRRPLIVEIHVPSSGGRGELRQRVKLIPDAFIELRVHDPAAPYRLNLAIEADRATEDQVKWRRKIQAYLAALEGVYQEAFAARSLTVMVVTTGGDERVRQLLRWTERELRHRRQETAGHLFRFAAAPAEWQPLSPVAFALEARWSRPFAAGAEPLVTLEVGGG